MRARGRRRSAPWALLALAAALPPACTSPSSYSGELSRTGAPAIPRARFFAGLGYRGYDRSWEPFDDQFSFLFTGQHHWPDVPVGLEWGLGFASDDARVDGERLLNSSTDLSIGPTKTLPLDGAGRFFLNLGAGAQLSFVREDIGACFCDAASDEWFAGYAHASLFWRAGWNWDVGFDLRWVRGEDVDLPGGPREGEYFQVLFGTGFAW